MVEYRRGFIIVSGVAAFLIVVLLASHFSGLYPVFFMRRPVSEVSPEAMVKLPGPRTAGSMSVEEAIAKRRSIREYSGEPLSLEELSQILWAAQGITDPRWGLRAAPSAGATYPLEVYVVVGDGGVRDLKAGVYHYTPMDHCLRLILDGDLRRELSKAALEQAWVAAAPVDLVIAAVYERTTGRYGERGIRYVHMEAGHVGENIYLQATALGLGVVTVGAFSDEDVQGILNLPEDQKPLYIIPVGRMKH